MSEQAAGTSDKYVLRVAGWLDPGWTAWFDGFEIARQGSGETVLSGFVVDQAALHGLLNRIRDLNLKLLSVRRV